MAICVSRRVFSTKRDGELLDQLSDYQFSIILLLRVKAHNSV
jgi:hypothetical protein